MNDKTDNICSISKFTEKSCFIMALMIFCGHKKDKVNLCASKSLPKKKECKTKRWKYLFKNK